MDDAVKKVLVDRFLMWPLPKSVRSDLCVTMDYAFPRSGTCLLNPDEAGQMVEYLFGDAPQSSAKGHDRPTPPDLQAQTKTS